jgi:hypothetical protein
MYGSSAGCPPKKPSKTKFITAVQKKKMNTGRKRGPLIGDKSMNGNKNRTKIAPSIATTPPILLGMARRIA